MAAARVPAGSWLRNPLAWPGGGVLAAGPIAAGRSTLMMRATAALAMGGLAVRANRRSAAGRAWISRRSPAPLRPEDR